MHPVLLEFGGYCVRAYGTLASVAAVLLVLHLVVTRKGLNLRVADIIDLVFFLTVFGVLGARVLFCLERWRRFVDDPVSALCFWQGGMVWYGGFFACAGGLWLFAKWKKRPVLHVTDFVLCGVPLFHGVARIGCFLSGCCGGKETTGWICVCGTDGVPRYPVQVYEAVANFALYLFLNSRGKRLGAGAVTGCYLVGYGLIRFVLEFARLSATPFILGLSSAQVSSLVLLVAGFVVLYASRANRT